MRKWLISACALLTMAGGAQAQSSSELVGTWAFRTDNYGPGGVLALSGAVTIRRSGSGYDVRMVAHEMGSDGDLTTAHENCRGAARGGAFTITCTVADNLPNYSPDNFTLHVTGPGEMEGMLESFSHAPAHFSRVR